MPGEIRTRSTVNSSMRLDQWLWAVRVYRTRPLAVAAIKGGHVKLNGQPTKPARDVHPGKVITAQTETLLRTLRVIGSPSSRVGAKLVPQYAEDLTPPEELERARARALIPVPTRPKGMGRPTKRDRRILDQLDS